MNDDLPDTLSRNSSPPRRLLAWCLGVAIVVGIVFLLPRPDAVVPPGVAVESGVAVLLEPDEADRPAGAEDALAVVDAPPVGDGTVADDEPVRGAEPVATDEVSGGKGAADDHEPSLASLFGERPALIAVRPEAFVVTVDGRRFKPGDRLAAGVVLDAIEQEALHFSHDGRTFSRTAFAIDSLPVMD